MLALFVHAPLFNSTEHQTLVAILAFPVAVLNMHLDVGCAPTCPMSVRAAGLVVVEVHALRLFRAGVLPGPLRKPAGHVRRRDKTASTAIPAGSCLARYSFGGWRIPWRPRRFIMWPPAWHSIGSRPTGSHVVHGRFSRCAFVLVSRGYFASVDVVRLHKSPAIHPLGTAVGAGLTVLAPQPIDALAACAQF